MMVKSTHTNKRSLAMCRRVLSAGLLLIGASAVQAQAQYACRTSSGSTYYSPRPCSGQGGLSYYGPNDAAVTKSYQPAYQRPPDPDASVQYMSPQCASKNDALRTAASRGFTYDKIADMRRDYQKSCQEEESDARQSLSKAMNEKRQDKLDAQKRETLDKDRASLKLQQCGESKRILVTKRARTDLTEGEKNELQRFEDNYRSRCS